MKKISIVFTMFMILLGITGCSDEDKVYEVHSKEEMLSIIDNLDCSRNNGGYSDYQVVKAQTTDDDLLSCRLKNQYTILNEELSEDESGNKVRTINLRLKNYDVEFSVISSLECTSSFSASCISSSYVITTDYQEKAEEYFKTKYRETNYNKYCNDSVWFCIIPDKNGIEAVTDYIVNYVQYLNNLEIRVLNKHVGLATSLMIHFQSEKVKYNGISFRILLTDGKYVLYTKDFEEIGSKENLYQYILNYAQNKNIF